MKPKIIKDLLGYRLSTMLIDEDDDENMVVFTGVVENYKEDFRLVLDDGVFLPIPEDVIERLKEVDDEVKEIFNNTNYFFPMIVGNIKEGPLDRSKRQIDEDYGVNK